MRKGKRVIAWLCAIGCIGTMTTSITVFAETVDGVDATQTTLPDAVISETAAAEDSYFTYYAQYSDETRPVQSIILEGEKQSGTAAVETVEGTSGVVLREGDDYALWTIDVPRSGVYSLYATYYPLEASGKDIQLRVALDGAYPFTEAQEMTLPRLWVDDIENEDGSFSMNALGSDLRPEQVEKPRWVTRAIRDILGMYSDPYLFYLEQGTHTVKVSCSREAVALNTLTFRNEETLPPHEQYLAAYVGKEVDCATVRQEAEYTLEKSTSVLYPSYDRSNAATLPNDPYLTRLNTIGGSNWTTVGSAITWTADVPEAGLYRLAFRVRQNFSDGLNAYRRLYINGEIPFAEADALVFSYSQNWYLKVVGDEDPLLVYLEPGDTITLECTSGSMDYPLREVQQAVLDLNELYRSVIMITGTSPSIYQDYALEAQIPNLSEDLMAVCDRLKKISACIMDELGNASAAAATIDEAVLVFEELAEDPYFIPDQLDNFKGNIESLASLLLSLGGQALEIDALYYIAPASEDPKVNANFFESFAFNFKKFVSSFVNDYSSVGTSTEGAQKSILVWAGIGRDQAQIISRLIEDEFTPQTGIGVELNLVGGNETLIKATLAGKGPEISLSVLETTPVNLAARGVLVDLSQFDLSKLKEEIYPSAWTPFEYNGGTYAIPETMAVDLIFYRTDIFESLGLKAPDTWDDFYHVLEVVQSNNLQVGLPEINSANQGASLAIATFNKFLYQNGGEYYNADQTKTMFETEVAYQAFEKTAELYRIYGVSRDLSFFNRFRSGEAPIGIAAYSFYTQLISAAPEIRGLWSFAPIPGTPKEDGTIDRTQSATVGGCVMMSAALERGVGEEAFSFLEWWCGLETQAQYAKELEGVLGIIGRITPANRVALKTLGWSQNELEIIDEALMAVKNPPQLLGNYTISRALTSALRGAINDKNTPRRSLALYNKDINDELTRKRKEFGLD